ncbi:hypothetical protein [Hymenobacter baengnokdamensis]|uniref:hypothetical protein n=1 Tax=Hymenobacter baengnokdamensis TaxID=2615203 RepID=UPI001245ACB1|nr:hypothetical protein [Hymenobacter baengnokdamensis]
MADSHAFLLGSLWDSVGNRVSDGQYVTDTETGRTHHLFSSLYSFWLGGHQSVARRLNSLLTPAELTSTSPLVRLFLTAASDSWVLTRQTGGRTILIPCFELLRVLFYEAGPGLLKHYFSRESLDTICTVVATPAATNQYMGHVSIRRRGLSTDQQCILAEQCFNHQALRAITAAHSNLAQALLRTPEGAYPQADFYLGRPIHLQANGFHFQVGQQRYFFVCSIWSLTNPFSFHQLLVDAPGSKSRLTKPAGDQANEPESQSTLLQTRQRPTTPLDSQELGNGRYRDATVRPHAKKGIAWPQVKPSIEKTIEASESAFSRRIPRTPDSLSHMPGGSDETKALVTQFADAPCEYQLTTYFQDFVDWFRQQPAYRVELLQLYNDEGLHGLGISLLSLHDDRAIAIAELQHRKGFFYFCELVSGGRAALIYQDGYAPLTPGDFNSLFATYKAQQFDWLKCKKQALGGKVAGRYVVHPRNHHTGGVATALRCHKLITGLPLS